MSDRREPHEEWPDRGSGADWLPQPPFGGSLPQHQPQQPPPHGHDPGHVGFGAAAPALDQNPWQDHTGQWHYPYAAGTPAQAPQHGGYVPHYVAGPQLVEQQQVVQAWEAQGAQAPQGYAQQEPGQPAEEQPVFVEEHELVEVGPPVYARPAAPVRDPQRTALAAVIAFISVVIALWAILGFVHSMADTLASVSAGNDKLSVQLKQANTGLDALATKTASVKQMQANSAVLRKQLEGIDGSMAEMLEGVAVIGAQMQAMNRSLGTLDGEISEVNDINGTMAADLAHINGGLKKQHEQVATMRGDVEGTSAALKALPPKLGTVNSRLTHINKIVCFMGENGILNNLKVHIKVPLIGEIGTAEVFATVVPAGSWRC